MEKPCLGFPVMGSPLMLTVIMLILVLGHQEMPVPRFHNLLRRMLETLKASRPSEDCVLPTSFHDRVLIQGSC